MDTKIMATYTRQKLKDIATEPLVTQAVTRVYAAASVGCLRCDFIIPETYCQISVQMLIKILQTRLPDVTFEAIDNRSINIDWS